MANEKFEKCPICGAWKLKKELTNHIGACSLYVKTKAKNKSPEVLAR
jgi:uncharacterized C2H2 Zn-finger protein